MEAVSVGIASNSEIKGILEILNYEIIHGTANFDYSPIQEEDFIAIFKYKNQKGFPYFVAKLNETVVGFATISPFREKKGYQHTIEHSIYVHHQHQGKKIGQQLLTSLISYSKQAGFKVMIAAIDAENTSSINFHDRFGFREVGFLPKVAEKFNRQLDLVLLQLDL